MVTSPSPQFQGIAESCGPLLSLSSVDTPPVSPVQGCRLRDRLRRARVLFAGGEYDACLELVEAANSQLEKSPTASPRDGSSNSDVISDLSLREEVQWLLGMVKKKLGGYANATSYFTAALNLSAALHAAGASVPSHVCLDALRTRGTCLLNRASYNDAMHDFKEWLVLRQVFRKDLDPTSVLYNLALCYKHQNEFEVAEYWFKLAFLQGSQADNPNKQRARDSLKLVRHIRMNCTEQGVAHELQKIKGMDDQREDISSRLLLLRTRIHYYLATSAYRKIALSRARPRWGFWTDPESERMSSEKVRKAIVQYATGLVQTFLAEGECGVIKDSAIVSYLTTGASQVVNDVVSGSKSTTLLRQILNFTAEFVLNFSSSPAWVAQGTTLEMRRKMCMLTEYPPLLPYDTVRCEDTVSFGVPEMTPPTPPADPPPAVPPAVDEDTVATPVPEPSRATPSTDKEVFAAHVPLLLGCDRDYGTPLLSSFQRMELAKKLPTRHTAHHWELRFSTKTHGFSMNTFYSSTDDAGSNIVLVEDAEGVVFGGYTTQSWRIHPSFYGTGETFVFTFNGGKLQTWRWTGENNFFIQSKAGYIAFGGGGSPALSIEGQTMLRGKTGRCRTFDSTPLTRRNDYEICCVECWTVVED